MNFTKIIDISPTISERLAVFPGDEPFQRKVSLDFNKGDNLTLSAISTSLHIGAHADAPSHYTQGASSIAERDLHFYLGPCQVIRIENLKARQRILPQDLSTKKIVAPRVLFYTGSYQAEAWNDDFNSLSPELVAYLHQKNVILIGIDTPSIDPASSKALESHATVSHYDMAILEGLVLDKVNEGTYQLIALPLKIANGDSSPVRSVLLS